MCVNGDLDIQMVEIGMGCIVCCIYEFSEISIVLLWCICLLKDVFMVWQLDVYWFEILVVVYFIDVLVFLEFVIEFGWLGGLGVFNGEGLIGCYFDVEVKIV